MSRVRNVVHANTTSRIENLRILISALLERQLACDEIGALLKVGDSCVSKYVKDLGALVEVACHAGGASTSRARSVYRLAVAAEDARAYLAKLETTPIPRATRAPSFKVASRDPSRRFHILAYDDHYSIRVSRAPVARDPLVAALFGPRAVGAEARV